MHSKRKHTRTLSDQIRSDDWKENKQTPIQPNKSPQIPNPSSATSPQSQQMPPPISSHVPVAMATNERTYQRRASCYEASNSSLDEMSNSSVSSNTNDNNTNNNSSASQLSQPLTTSQPLSFKGFLRSKLTQTSLARSQSDSQKKRMHAFKFLKSARSLSNENFPALKSSDNISERSDSKASDSTSDADVLQTLLEEAHMPETTTSSNQPFNHSIMACEEEEEDEIKISKLYSRFEDVVKQRNTITSFLHFLIENSNPVPLLFYLMVEAYMQAGSKDQLKWAYELYSSFIHSSAPLRLPGDLDTTKIDSLMCNKVEKEELGALFESMKQHCVLECRKQLVEFNNKLSLGLGSMYGVNQTDWERVSLPVFNYLASLTELKDARSVTMSACLYAFWHWIGLPSNEKAPSFVHKGKSKLAFFKSSKKTDIQMQEHQLCLQQFNCTTYCHHCSLLVFGLAPQAYICLRCECAYHRECVEGIEERCVGARKVDWLRTSAGLLRKKNSRGSKGKLDETDGAAPLPRTVSLVSFREASTHKPFFKNKLLRDEIVEHTEHSGAQRPSLVKSFYLDSMPHALTTSPTSNATLQSTNSYDSQATLNLQTCSEYLEDSDFELENETGALEKILSREVLKKMKPREKKRQNVIMELLHTERAHVRNLKVMHNVIFMRLAHNCSPPFVFLLFPNLSDLISVHEDLKRVLKERQSRHVGQSIPSISDILFTHFTGESQARLMEVCAIFCEKQGQALDELRSRQKKDAKLASILHEAQSHPLCRRFELKDLLPAAMQRLTKYPLLITSLLKLATEAEAEDLKAALVGSKEVLAHVNSVVRRHDNHLKLVSMQRKLEKKNFDNHPVMSQYQDLELTKHRLLFDGDMTWRMNREKQCEVHVVLLEKLLLLLLKQDDKLVLKCQSTCISGRQDTRTTHCPLIPLINVLVKVSASDDKAFFLVSQLKDISPQFYDLVAPSPEDRKRWCSQIEGAVEAFRLENPHHSLSHINKHRKMPSSSSTISLPLSTPPNTTSITRSSTIPSSHPSSLPIKAAPAINSSPQSPLTDTPHSSEETLSQESTAESDTKVSLLERLQELDGTIESLMMQKWAVIEELGGVLERTEGEWKSGKVDGVKAEGLEDIEWLLWQAEGLLRDLEGCCIDEKSKREAGNLERDAGTHEVCFSRAQHLLLKSLSIQRTMHSVTHLLQSNCHPSIHSYPSLHSSNLQSTQSPDHSSIINHLPTHQMNKPSTPSPTPPPINSFTHPTNQSVSTTPTPKSSPSTTPDCVVMPTESISASSFTNITHTHKGDLDGLTYSATDADSNKYYDSKDYNDQNNKNNCKKGTRDNTNDNGKTLKVDWEEEQGESAA